VIRRSPIETVIGSVVTVLKASTGVTGLATGGVFNNVPQNTPYPYVEVTSPLDQRVDTFSRRGNEAKVTVKAVTQAPGDQQGARIINACVSALEDAVLATSQHSTLGITWDNGERYKETINGVTTRYHVGEFRVWTEQTS
jgi:hypothetical protein